MPRQSLAKAFFRRCQRRVEESDPKALSAQEGSYDERLERRIRLHLPHLLAVVVEMVAVSQKHFDHVSRHPRIHAPATDRSEASAAPPCGRPRAASTAR